MRIIVLTIIVSVLPMTAHAKKYYKVPIALKSKLLKRFDRDHNFRVSVDDFTVIKDDKFCWEDKDRKRICLKGYYDLSNLLQELTLAEQRGEKIAEIPHAHIDENPVLRVSRMIKGYYWKGLTRSFDKESFARILPDPKIDHYKKNKKWYLWISDTDIDSVKYFKNLHKKLKGKIEGVPFEIEILPRDKKITPKFVQNLTRKNMHGALALKMEKNENGEMQGVPFVVPGGRFNEMYGWDSYFECKGLLVDGRTDLCKSMVDNLIFQINRFGKILNANRTYYLNRSQPPFLTQMALATYQSMNSQPKADKQKNKEWLAVAIRAAIKEYDEVWTNKKNRGRFVLSTYYGEGLGLCLEVEPGGYDEVLVPYAKKKGFKGKKGIAEYQKLYNEGKIKDSDLDEFVTNDRAIRESGNDTTYRFDNRASDFLAVDLNSLLYRYEIDIADTIKNVFNDNLILHSKSGKKKIETSKKWYERAEKRKNAINAMLWNDKKGMYFDYDMKNKRQSDYVFASTFYPIWAGLATQEQAKRIVENALPKLEAGGGILSSYKKSVGKITKLRPQRQWDYPYGWAPHQMIAWRGLKNYGFNKEANRLIYKWLLMIAVNARDYNGTVPEKYDVVKRSHNVFAEYGNVGVNFSYITKEGFGWMNASYQLGLMHLKLNDKKLYNKLLEESVKAKPFK